MAGRLKEKDISTDFKLQIANCKIKTLQFCILIFTFCTCSCGTPYGIYHSVEKGQTLYGIAKTYNVPSQEIVRINRFKEHVTLKEGDAVFIPGASREKDDRCDN